LALWADSAWHGLGVVLVMATIVASPSGYAQQGATSGRLAAAVDVAGNWVSLVTDEWSLRMLTPRKGDYRYLPLNEAGRAFADQWDPASDEAAGRACQAYAAPAIMRLPSRLRIGWQDDMTLRIDIDTGTQTRMLHFDTAVEVGLPTWQGHSLARWQPAGDGDQTTQSAGVGTLRVDTTNLRAGYLQKNGVPFSAETFMTEYFNVLETGDGTEYLIVQIFVDDPVFLAAHWVRTVTFRRAAADEKSWNPTRCTAY
jgi:hypothetical protein